MKERSCTLEAAIHHMPKQVALHTCPEQPLVVARTQAERADSRSRSRDCVSRGGDHGGWDRGGDDDLLGYKSLVVSYAPCAPFDMSLKDMLG